MRVSDLTAVEQKVWDAFVRGEEVDVRTGDPARDDPAKAAAWSAQRSVRAEVLLTLLLGGASVEPGYLPALCLAGARIDGDFDLDYAEIPYRIRLTGCDFPQRIGIHNARLRHFSLEDCRLECLFGVNAAIDGSLRLSGCRTSGALNLDGARISGVLNLDGAQLSNPRGAALEANRIEVDDHVWMRDGFSALGGIVLRGARVGGDVDLTGATIANSDGIAVWASRMRVDGSVLANELRAEGEARFNGSVIAGELSLAKARLSNPGKTALSGHFTQISADLDGYGLQAHGRVELIATKVSGLILSHAVLEAAGDRALELWQAEAKQFDLRTATPPIGLVDLRHASVGILHDAPQSWPAELNIDGLRYDYLGSPLPAAQRVPWLLRNADGYAPQPFEQLARAYKALGHENEARTVLLAKERLRHRTMSWYARIWGAVQDVTVGYGYRPVRAAAWLLALLALGSTVFATHPPIRNPPTGDAAFNPAIFTLDQLLPVIGFGQRSAFTPTPGTQWLGYLLTAAGWLLATTIATGVTRSVNRI